jgi:hypothetical protein
MIENKMGKYANKIQKYYRITPYWRTDCVYRKVQQIVVQTVDW